MVGGEGGRERETRTGLGVGEKGKQGRAGGGRWVKRRAQRVAEGQVGRRKDRRRSHVVGRKQDVGERTEGLGEPGRVI